MAEWRAQNKYAVYGTPEERDAFEEGCSTQARNLALEIERHLVTDGEYIRIRIAEGKPPVVLLDARWWLELRKGV